MPNATVEAIDWPVAYSDDGTILPTITTPLVNSSEKPNPSNTVSSDTIVGFEMRPHNRNPVAYTRLPSR